MQKRKNLPFFLHQYVVLVVDSTKIVIFFFTFKLLSLVNYTAKVYRRCVDFYYLFRHFSCVLFIASVQHFSSSSSSRRRVIIIYSKPIMSSLTTSTLSKFTMSVRRTGRRSVVVAVLLQPLLLFLFLFMSLVALGEAKTYDRCQLASDLLHKYKLPANQISQCN